MLITTLTSPVKIPLGRIVQLCPLTAQQRSKVFNMKWSEIEGNTWTLPLKARAKGNAGVHAAADGAGLYWLIDDGVHCAQSERCFVGNVAQ